MSKVVNIQDYLSDYENLRALLKTEKFVVAFINPDDELPIIIGAELQESEFVLFKHYIDGAWQALNE